MGRNNNTRIRKTYAAAALLLLAAAALFHGLLSPSAAASVHLDDEDDYARETFQIAGRVSDLRGQPLSGVRVTLGGARAARVYTNREGEYRFANLAGGVTYRVTVSKSDYSFDPPSFVFRRLDDDEFPEHTATVTTASISGRVTDFAGRAVRDATVTLSGARSVTVSTDDEGFYRFYRLPAGEHYRVTVTKGGLRFLEPSRVFDELEGHRTADFEGARVHAILGQVLLGGRGLRDVTVRLTGRGVKQTVQTDGAGYFSFNDLPGGTSYTLTASKPGVTFSPSRQTFSLSGDVRV
ncbi:MAG TPA: carboxypeptidase-like regulatory domain-containing protein, partial [Pyrinomonadaceae bacterium]|nr:carboxypeptidase-like regulatory domain-containing protein [Pyrinomonadaceae bacterium]